jgi:hypothetical protein
MVVPGGPERGQHRRIEATSRALARGECEPGELEQLRTDLETALTVEAGELGVRPEA